MSVHAHFIFFVKDFYWADALERRLMLPGFSGKSIDLELVLSRETRFRCLHLTDALQHLGQGAYLKCSAREMRVM